MTSVHSSSQVSVFSVIYIHRTQCQISELQDLEQGSTGLDSKSSVSDIAALFEGNKGSPESCEQMYVFGILAAGSGSMPPMKLKCRAVLHCQKGSRVTLMTDVVWQCGPMPRAYVRSISLTQLDLRLQVHMVFDHFAFCILLD